MPKIYACILFFMTATLLIGISGIEAVMKYFNLRS